MKREKVFQAGYSDGSGNWLSCGYGKNIEAARKKLESRILTESTREALKYADEFEEKYGFQMRQESFNGFLNDIKDFYRSGRYQEQSYYEEE